jgi:hypothetical protein
MRTVAESLSIVRGIAADLEILCEAKPSKLTPYQKAQQKRRQTIATHTVNPAKQSIFYKHAVRAIFSKLRKQGDSFQGSAKGGQNIAKWMLKHNGYGTPSQDKTGEETGGVKLTGKGIRRNRMHAAEPKGVRDRKEKAYDWIMGIQRKKAQQKQAVQRKSASAG